MLNQIKLAISPIAWTNDDDPSLGGDISFEQCIEEMKLAGYKGTELGSKYPNEAKVLKEKLIAHDLSLSSAWFSSYFTDPNRYQSTIESFFKHISFLKSVGAGIVNVCECANSIQQTEKAILGDEKPVFNEVQWQRLFDGLHHIGRIAVSFDMKIAYHFHLGTGVQTADEVSVLMDNTSPSLVGLLLDTGHAYVANAKPVSLIEKYHARINLVHLKDIRLEVLNKVKEEQFSFMEAVKQGLFTVPGDGCVDFDNIFSVLGGKNYQGWMVVEAEQDPEKANPLLYAKKARKYLAESFGV